MFSLPIARTSFAQEQFFHGAVRAHERTDGLAAVVALDLAQAAHDVLERGLPVDRAPLAAMLDHGRGEAFGGIERS